MKKINYMMVAMVAVSVAACSKAPGPLVQSTVPADWYRLPENVSALTASGDSGSEQALEKVLDQTFAAQEQALDQASVNEVNTLDSNSVQSLGPSNLTRWHLGFFMTDLSVSVKGVLGALTGKGTPTVQLFWRKKEKADAAKPVAKLAEETPTTPADISITEESSDAAVESQLNDTVNVLMAGGKIANESALRENLRIAMNDFRELTRGLDNNPGHEWWVSRFRLDLTVDASGKVANYFTSIGGELRVRIEWHRVRSKTPHTTTKPASIIASPTKHHFDELVNLVAADLPAMTAGANQSKGFQPFTFRVGVGITAGGNIGIAKANGTVTGHIYFSHDTPKPAVKASNLMLAEGSEAPSLISLPQVSTIPMVEVGANNEHVAFAQKNGIRVEKIKGAMETFLVHLDRAAFRKGLEKAGKMAKFFTRHAHKHVVAGHWGIYEMRVGFDTSYTGKLPLATVGGLATTEICLYNEEF